MKSVIQSVALAVVLAAPVAVLAQSNLQITREQVRAELVQMERAGYTPARFGGSNYPDDIQAAQATVAAVNNAPAVGGVADGTSEAGGPAVATTKDKTLYLHH
ncbi:DUF4148 domain-containing protein [Paraburkholderia dinghuensis]|uniref:DUF4148 domain-containing protein n=1 Tax=Paraburkholderia dinghuensis TaxID=2305225 RepID=A0A3N6MU98_9BURK|nr:DUF4148 domain-containing protein [Paraburkholderia dinghuensis]RQH05485.1 DUF4148 domain-containing protein [Paraburkholderia dinghuensis]